MRKVIVVVLMAVLMCGVSIGLAFAGDGTESGDNNSTSITLPALLNLSTGLLSGDNNSTSITIPITIQQAVDMALGDSNTIKSAVLDVESKQETRKAIGNSNDILFVPSGPTSSTTMSAYISLVSSNINWEMAQKTLTVDQDALLYSVLKDYTATLNAIDALKYAQLSANNAQVKWNIAMITYQQGMASSYDRSQMEQVYKAAQTTLTTAAIDLDNAYQALNKDIGLQPTDRPILTEQPKYSLFKIDDLEAEINRTIGISPQVWKADKSIETTKLSQDLYNWNSSDRSQPFRNTQIAVSQAEISAANTRQQTETLLRNTYNTIAKNEEQYQTALKALSLAQENLIIAKVKYEVGMLTKVDLNDIEIAVLDKTKSLNSLVYQHELAKMAFEKPWASS
jgi:outer membrane protein